MGDPSPRFRLYLPGPGPRSDAVERTVRSLGDDLYGSDGWTLEVVDVRAAPEEARSREIFLSPALHRLSPGPERRWIGNLADAETLATAMSDDHE